VTEIEESLEANEVERRMNDLLLADAWCLSLHHEFCHQPSALPCRSGCSVGMVLVSAPWILPSTLSPAMPFRLQCCGRCKVIVLEQNITIEDAIGVLNVV
jgi:hypothetical protein